ncbi:MAG: hypothetical protein V5786_07890 [Psychromonas sp.]
MAKRNRSTLRNYFRAGAMPNEAHFNDLIDSTLNTLEEGFDKTVEQGFKISALDNNANLITFYRDSAPNDALWSMHYYQQSDTLSFTAAFSNNEQASIDSEPKNVLSLSQAGHVGINNAQPMYQLDINGTTKTDGLIGSEIAKKAAPADGKWHNISSKLEGCQAFNVVLGVGVKRSGRYALLYATAMNTCDPKTRLWGLLNWKKPIKSQQAHYRSTADKLKLRWVAAPKSPQDDPAYRPYYLQVKSNTAYSNDVFIQGHMTQLWFDQYMNNSVIPEDKVE